MDLAYSASASTSIRGPDKKREQQIASQAIGQILTSPNHWSRGVLMPISIDRQGGVGDAYPTAHDLHLKSINVVNGDEKHEASRYVRLVRKARLWKRVRGRWPSGRSLSRQASGYYSSKAMAAS